jgi:hypothetical protein
MNPFLLILIVTGAAALVCVVVVAAVVLRETRRHGVEYLDHKHPDRNPVAGKK